MPGLYQAGEYDLAGAIVGIAERDKLITGHRVAAGDIILGLPSTGLHTNGYSLARKLIFETAGLKPDSYVEDFGATVAEELLKVHRSYLKPIRALHAARLLRAAAHITGGGLTENTPRVLPKGLAVRIDVTSWRVPPVFEFLRRIGSVPVDDWRRTFNLGVGMLLIVAAKDAPQAEVTLRKLRERPFVIGEVVTQRRGKDRVTYD
jgi:phosphoribosylformylglycinamidine cyclo-ligase